MALLLAEGCTALIRESTATLKMVIVVLAGKFVMII